MSGTAAPPDARSAPRPVLHCRLGWPVGGDSCLPPSPRESRSQRADAATSRRRGRQANHAAGTHSITKKYSSIYISYICIICIETLPCGNVSTAALLPHVKTPASEAPCLSHRRLLLLLLLLPSSPSSWVGFFCITSKVTDSICYISIVHTELLHDLRHYRNINNYNNCFGF